MIGQILGLIIILGAVASYFKKWFILAVLILVALWLIRKGADIFWWGKDNNKW